jgi:hypothetical protein
MATAAVKITGSKGRIRMSEFKILYEDRGHRSFTGRHAYFHDPDGNAIEFIDFQGIGDTGAPDDQGRERRRAKPHLADKTPA